MMDFSRMIGVCILVLLCAASLAADESVPARAVSGLVSQLNAASRVEREAAERKLIELGPDVLDALPRSSSDPATNAALSRIRKRLSKQRATDQATRPRAVSIVGTGPLGDVAANWLDDEGLPRIALSPEQKSRRVSLKLQNVSYWKAIDRMTEEAGLWPAGWDQSGRLTFRERTSEDGEIRLAYPGAFRVAGGAVTVKALPGGTENVLYRLPLEIRAEPGVRPLFIMYAAESGALIGEDGTRLEAFTPGATYELPVGEAGGLARLRLDFAGPSAKEPFTFTGRFQATIASRDAPFAFELSRGSSPSVEQTRGEVTVRLQSVTWNDDQSIEIAIAAIYAGVKSTFESYRTWVYHNDAILIIERNNGETSRIPHEPAFDTVAQSPGALLLRYRFENVPADAEELRFEYRAPTEVIEAPLDVELEGLAVE